MKKIVLLPTAMILVLIFANACQQKQEETYETEWLGNTKEELLENIEFQFQGFSRTMNEVNYRYQELYWAGKEENWDYAEYQREHIWEAMEQGYMRRPEHEKSGRIFMENALPAMEETIQERILEDFEEQFKSMTDICNACHHMEEVAFIKIVEPTIKTSVVEW